MYNNFEVIFSMEERKKDFSQIFFSAFLNAAKEIKIPFIYFQDEDGSYFSECEVLTTHGDGQTLEASIDNMICNMRESAEIYCEDLPFWLANNPGEFPYILKIMMSNDEELKSCLAGEICEDF